MEPKSIFHYRNYKAYIQDIFDAKPHRGRGEKAKLAQAMQSHGAFVSQVLNAKADLSPEQACLASDYFGHTEEESHFFLLLVQWARAGNARLKGTIEKQIRAVEEKRATLKNRVGPQDTLSLERQSTYYSHWMYSALHVAVAVPSLQTTDALARHFRLSPSEIKSYLEFLLDSGLVQRKDGQLVPGVAHIFLPKESPLVSKHLMNWRLKAMQSIPAVLDENVHYSVVVSLSQDDRDRLRKMIYDFVEKANAIVRPSKEETLACLGIDFFEVK
jgi:uncharacterized protein (TIGR02147 family)